MSVSQQRFNRFVRPLTDRLLSRGQKKGDDQSSSWDERVSIAPDRPGMDDQTVERFRFPRPNKRAARPVSPQRASRASLA